MPMVTPAPTLCDSLLFEGGAVGSGHRLMSLAASRLMLWPSILAAVAVRFRLVALMAMSLAWIVVPLTVLLVLALSCLLELAPAVMLTPKAEPLLGSDLAGWR